MSPVCTLRSNHKWWQLTWIHLHLMNSSGNIWYAQHDQKASTRLSTCKHRSSHLECDERFGVQVVERACSAREILILRRESTEMGKVCRIGWGHGASFLHALRVHSLTGEGFYKVWLYTLIRGAAYSTVVEITSKGTLFIKRLASKAPHGDGRSVPSPGSQ